jgi:hypothetical protein
MTQGKINEEVLKVLHDKTKENEILRDFLIDLIFAEREQVGRWHFKKYYQEKIEEYVQKKEGSQ